MTTLRVGAEQLRRELADLLARVGYAGDRVIVERHGTPQAVLIPFTLYEEFATWLEQTPAQSPTEADVLKRLIDRGIVRAPEKNASNQPRPERRLIQTKGRPLSEVIIEERR